MRGISGGGSQVTGRAAGPPGGVGIWSEGKCEEGGEQGRGGGEAGALNTGDWSGLAAGLQGWSFKSESPVGVGSSCCLSKGGLEPQLWCCGSLARGLWRAQMRVARVAVLPRRSRLPWREGPSRIVGSHQESFCESIECKSCNVFGLSLLPKWRPAQEEATVKGCCQSPTGSCNRI